MPVSKSYRCEALVLKNSPFGEAGAMVTFFTRDHGKVRAVARGARRSTSKLVGHLEPLTHVQLAMAHGRNLDYINQAQVIRDFSGLRGELDVLAKALYVAELVDGFGAEANSNPALYDLALETLHSIEEHQGGPQDSEWPLRFFELHLLRVSGLMPELYLCVECRQTLSPGHHRFGPTVGGALCFNCRPESARVFPMSLRALKVLRLMHRGPLKEVIALKGDPTLRQEVKVLTSGALSYWLEREIRSNSFLDQLYSESEKGVYT